MSLAACLTIGVDQRYSKPNPRVSKGLVLVAAGLACSLLLGAPAAADFQYKKGSFLKSDNTAVPVNDQMAAGVR